MSKCVKQGWVLFSCRHFAENICGQKMKEMVEWLELLSAILWQIDGCVDWVCVSVQDTRVVTAQSVLLPSNAPLPAHLPIITDTSKLSLFTYLNLIFLFTFHNCLRYLTGDILKLPLLLLQKFPIVICSSGDVLWEGSSDEAIIVHCRMIVNFFLSMIEFKFKKNKTMWLGKPSFKKKWNFMKKFHKMVTPPPRTAFMKSLFFLLFRALTFLI